MPKFETAGKFWPVVHNCVIFSLILMQAIAVGIFALKKLALASSLTIPLPILTLIFDEYCRKRFLPMFDTYSAEVLHNLMVLLYINHFELFLSVYFVVSCVFCDGIYWSLLEVSFTQSFVCRASVVFYASDMFYLFYY